MSINIDRTAVRLRSFILEGQLSPGTVLDEVDLAAMLGVGWKSVSGALHVLSSQGLVEIQSNAGIRVAHWSDADLAEIYELRIMLESHAAGRAAGRVTDVAIKEIDLVCADMEECAGRPGPVDVRRLVELNRRFHASIVAAAESPRLATMLESAVHPQLECRMFRGCTRHELGSCLRHHRELLGALRSGSSTWAESIMRSHLLAEGAWLSGRRT